MNLHLLVTDQGRDTHSALEEVRAATEKPDKMEETLTCIICQDLLHDCVRCARVGRLGAMDKASFWVRFGSSLLMLPLSFSLNGQQAKNLPQ